MSERLWTVNDLARHLDVHITTLQTWIRKGHFPHARKRGPGRNSPWAIPDSDVQALQAQLYPVWEQAPTDGSAEPA